MSPAFTRSPSRTRSFADHAAGRVLHLLDVGIDDERALRDHRAGDFGGRRPAADADRQERDDHDAAAKMWRRIDARAARRSVLLRVRCRMLLPSHRGTTFSAARLRRGGCVIARLQDFLLRPELLLAALGHDQSMVDAGDRARAMGDHHDDAAARAHAEDGVRQRLVAFGVEIGIGLVEHDEERIADRARAPARCAAPGRPRARCLFADLRLVAVAAA